MSFLSKLQVFVAEKKKKKENLETGSSKPLPSKKSLKSVFPYRCQSYIVLAVFRKWGGGGGRAGYLRKI